MYINKSKIFPLIIVWSVMFVIFFTTAFTFIGMACYSTKEPTLCALFLILAAGSILLIRHFFIVLSNLAHLIRLNSLLRSDEDGSVPVEDIASYLRMTRPRLNKMLDYGEKKHILINVVRDVTGDRLVLTDRFAPEVKTADRPFVGINCPGCASPLKLRAGSTGVCPFCGRDVTAPDIVIER